MTYQDSHGDTRPDRPTLEITQEMIDAGVTELACYGPESNPDETAKAIFEAMWRAMPVPSHVRALFSSDEIVANAHLIAAAPELCAALENIKNRIMRLPASDAVQHDAFISIQMEAESALRKARGETP